LCHILFISKSEDKRISAILQSINTGILTVSDIGLFIEHGGIIGFIIVDNKVKFEINLKASEKAGIKISSKLLKLAKSIKGQNKPEGS